jgi:hypothetical protein
MSFVRFAPPGARGPACRAALVAAVALAALAILLTAPRAAVAAPLAAAGSPSLVFSEIYAPLGSDSSTQWFEIHNLQSAAAYPLENLILATSSKQMTVRSSVVISPAGYVLFVLSPDAVSKGLITPMRGAQVVTASELGSLDPRADALIFYTPDKTLVIDQVNWGKPDHAWLNYNSDMWDPGLAPLDLSTGSRLRTWGRTPSDRDTNLGAAPAGDWTQHETPTPGGRVSPPPQSDFLGPWTDWAGGVSSLLLWAAFVIIAIIAYRFERLRDTRTYWQLLLLAPSGILFYTAIVIIGFSQKGGLTNDQKWLSFPVLALSALFCLIAVGIFRNVARALLEGE